MTLSIAAATENDIPELCALLQVLFQQEAEFSPNVALQARGLAQIISQPNIGCILLARQHTQAVGMVNLLYTVSTALGGRVALLEDMLVLPEQRNRGVGSRLIQQAIITAKQHGCLRITLLTDQDNIKAQGFYQKHGFNASTMLPMRLDLSAD